VHEEIPLPSHSRAQLDAMMIDQPKPRLPRRLLSERFIGEFMRSFTFPMEVDADDMKASLSDGLLRITVLKTADTVTEAKRIPVT
jgi:HSP20 family molecular chaperone IbpA